MTKQWRIAVIGAGDMGRHHVDGWRRNGQEVVSVTDMDQERACALAEEFGIGHVFADYREAVARPDVDIVSICLPLPLHAEVTIAAAKCGKHVFCEKPLAPDFAEAAKMERAVREAGVAFGLGFQRNLTKGVLAARDWVRSGKFGRPVVFACDSVAEIRPKRIMHDAAGNRGPLMDLGCHYYAMWETVFGSRPRSVHAVGRVLADGRAELSHIAELAIDTAVVTVEYESGDIGVFTVSWGLPPGFRMRAHTDRIYGPKGGAEGGFNHNSGRLVLYEEDRSEEIALEVYPSLHAEQFRLFTDAIGTGADIPAGFAAGKEALALTLAIFRSIETGRPVDFAPFREELFHEARPV